MTDNTKGLSDDPEAKGPQDDHPVVEGAQEQGDPSGSELGAGLPEPDTFEVVDEEAEELDVDPDDPDQQDDTPDKGDPSDVVIDDVEQLDEATSVAAAARSARPVRKTVEAASTGTSKKRKRAEKVAEADEDASADVPAKSATTAKKGRVTRSRAEATTKLRHKRTTPALFVEQSVAELKKVNWPTGSQLRQYFIVVLIFVLFIIAFVGLLDFAFGWVLLKALGSK